MPFVVIPGLAGKVYVPPRVDADGKKHPCPDCHCCQVCAESRCNLCRTRPGDGERAAGPARRCDRRRP